MDNDYLIKKTALTGVIFIFTANDHRKPVPADLYHGRLCHSRPLCQ